MADSLPSRRAFVAGTAATAASALAGCGAVGSNGATPTPLGLNALDERTIYVDPSLSLTVPPGVDTVDAPADADVVVVPGDTDTSRSAIVHWLARDASVAFVGDDAQATWHDVKESGAYAAMLGEPQAMSSGCAATSSGGAGSSASTDCEPPDLLVARYLQGEELGTTYRKTWADTENPGGREVFEAIDEAVAGEA